MCKISQQLGGKSLIFPALPSPQCQSWTIYQSLSWEFVSVFPVAVVSIGQSARCVACIPKKLFHWQQTEGSQDNTCNNVLPNTLRKTTSTCRGMKCVLPKFLFALQQQEVSHSDKSFQTLSKVSQCDHNGTSCLLTDIVGNFLSLRIRLIL